MTEWKRNFRSWLIRKGKPLIWISLLALFTYLCVYLTVYYVYPVYHCYKYQVDGVACVWFQGRLANAMFQQAFLYSFSKDKKLDVLIYGDYPHPLSHVFELNGFTWREDINGSCGCSPMIFDRWDCAYDESFETLPERKTARLHGYFQSWKYLKKHEAEILKMFTFHSNLQKAAENKLRFIIEAKKSTGVNKKHVLVGIHIRRGDFVESDIFRKFGYVVVPKTYIYKAIEYFQNKYSNVLFIVGGNDIRWSKTVLGNYKNMYFLQDNSPALDMAILSQTNHTIMTVGTFGWWVAYLTNGTTIYYKYPYRKGSDFEKQFHGSTTDHFPPNWIGLE